MLLSAARPIASLTTVEALDALQSQVSGLDNAEALRQPIARRQAPVPAAAFW